jgi:hypothetical protein
MIKADKAEVSWDEQKKNWLVRVQTGEEVIRRHCKDAKEDASDDVLRSLAVSTATDEGYELASDTVTIKR